MYIKPIQIGDIEIANNIFLAPMAGITDKSFRKIVKKYSNPGLVYTEMVSSRAICYDDQKTWNLINQENEKRPVAVQIFGSEPDIMAKAAKKIEDKADIIDINMGCPAPKVVKNGDGSKLLLNLDLAEEIVSKVVEAVKKPVTVKLRKGWDDENNVAVEMAKRIERAGAKLITIHGRTRKDFYSGHVDLDTIKQVKYSVSIPVIGNGDVKIAQDAIKMFEYTSVDGIMIGRASLGAPWQIGNIIEELEEKPITNFSNEDKLNIMLEHINLELEEKGSYIGIREMRKHLCWYLKNLKNSSAVRQEINQIENVDKLVQVLKAYFSSL
ncbi:MAG: tRNA dihydrouridine synthase DusB [Clostridia bacterium]